MVDSISKAKQCFEKIEYYRKNSGPQGYDQALYFYDKLIRVLMSSNTNHQPLIASIKGQADQLMEEMKLLKDMNKK